MTRRDKPRLKPGQAWFELETDRDLLKKLKHDYDRVDRDVSDSYAAFDFFVTAHHLADWWNPPGTKREQGELRDQVKRSPLGKLCADIANGAKHFSGPPQTGMHYGAFSNEFSWEFDRNHILIRPTDPDVIQEFGRETYLITVAQRVMAEWEARLGR
jgi:hypothetical protein